MIAKWMLHSELKVGMAKVGMDVDHTKYVRLSQTTQNPYFVPYLWSFHSLSPNNQAECVKIRRMDLEHKITIGNNSISSTGKSIDLGNRRTSYRNRT